MKEPSCLPLQKGIDSALPCAGAAPSAAQDGVPGRAGQAVRGAAAADGARQVQLRRACPAVLLPAPALALQSDLAQPCQIMVSLPISCHVFVKGSVYNKHVVLEYACTPVVSVHHFSCQFHTYQLFSRVSYKLNVQLYWT